MIDPEVTVQLALNEMIHSSRVSRNIIENFVHIFSFVIFLETYFLIYIFIDRARSARFLSPVDFNKKFSINFTGILITPQFRLVLV